MESSYQELSEFKSEGKLDRRDSIDIKFEFLDEVSSQLYRNPRRAVEELVCNSYDAGATECYISTPEETDDQLLVLDNGASMDEEGLDRLWDIADSPKKKLEEDPDEERKKYGRQQIGKFGIGKLAAFAIGNTLTHVATKEGRTRVVTVAKEDIEGRDSNDPPKCEIFGLDEDEAKEYLSEYFERESMVNPWEQTDESWDDWTLALVDDIKPNALENGFNKGILKRMIRTAIPLSTDFTIELEGDVIEERTPDSPAIAEIKLGEDGKFKSYLEDDLKQAWKDINSLEDESEVGESKYQCSFTSIEGYEEGMEDLDAIEVPELGPIVGTAAIYQETLTSPKRKKRDVQDHGYRIKVRGKLVNRGEALFDTPQKSFKYWSRFLADIEIPELDDAILLQRDSIEESRIEARITREVLDSIFNYLRNQAKGELSKDENDYSPETFFKRLNTLSPQKAPEALKGMAERADGSEQTFPKGGWDDVDIIFADGNPDDDLTVYDPEDHEIQINKNHTLLNALDEDGFPDTSREVIGEALAGQFLSVGYLQFNKVDPNLIDGSVELMENAARSAARLIQNEPEYYSKRLKSTVKDGDTPFERAVVDALLHLGLDVEHYGESDYPDAVVTVSRPTKNFRVAVEAKGGDSESTDHREASIGTMHEHAEEMNCQHSVLVSSEEILQLRGQSESDDSSLLNQMNMNDDVSILTVETLSKMLELHRENPYDYTQLKNIIQNRVPPSNLGSDLDPNAELPSVKLRKEIEDDDALLMNTSDEGRPQIEISNLSQLAAEWWEEMPRDEQVVRAILEAAKSAQDKHESESSRPLVGMIYREDPLIEENIEEDDIRAVLSSAAITGLVDYPVENSHYEIHQSVDEIMEKMNMELDTEED